MIRNLLRAIDLVLSVMGFICLSPLMVLVGILCFIETRSPIFLQIRVGKHEKTFTLIKFRTMAKNTGDLPTHEVSESAITRSGTFLRKSKLDELPQLLNVILGQMSLVGPRPCLPTQLELIEERRKQGVFSSAPGITGLSQLRGIDMSKPELVAKTDREMLENRSIKQYTILLIWTAMKIARSH